MNTPVQTIAQYENGNTIPNNAFIVRVEKQLNVKLSCKKIFANILVFYYLFNEITVIHNSYAHLLQAW